MGNKSSTDFTMSHEKNVRFIIKEVYLHEELKQLRMEIADLTVSDEVLQTKLKELLDKKKKMKKFLKYIVYNMKRGMCFNEAFGKLCSNYNVCGCNYCEMHVIIVTAMSM